MKLVLASSSCAPSYLGTLIFWSKISVTHEAEVKSLLFSCTKPTECQKIEEFPFRLWTRCPDRLEFVLHKAIIGCGDDPLVKVSFNCLLLNGLPTAAHTPVLCCHL